VEGCQAFGVLCDKREQQKLKGKFYSTSVMVRNVSLKRYHVQQIIVQKCVCCVGFMVIQEGIESRTMIYVIG
jgi:hypothetical protein